MVVLLILSILNAPDTIQEVLLSSVCILVRLPFKELPEEVLVDPCAFVAMAVAPILSPDINTVANNILICIDLISPEQMKLYIKSFLCNSLLATLYRTMSYRSLKPINHFH